VYNNKPTKNKSGVERVYKPPATPKKEELPKVYRGK
jgi:hypothetical protein